MRYASLLAFLVLLVDVLQYLPREHPSIHSIILLIMTPDIISDGWILKGKELAAMRKREYHYNAWSDTILDTYMQP